MSAARHSKNWHAVSCPRELSSRNAFSHSIRWIGARKKKSKTILRPSRSVRAISATIPSHRRSALSVTSPSRASKMQTQKPVTVVPPLKSSLNRYRPSMSIFRRILMKNIDKQKSYLIISSACRRRDFASALTLTREQSKNCRTKSSTQRGKWRFYSSRASRDSANYDRLKRKRAIRNSR